jgi:CubicO group peptidase (beta-lactamase class C family)
MISLILCLALADPAGALEATVDRAAADGKFSGVVLLAKEGKPVMLRAWGDGNRTDTKFNLASINKIFTQTAIAQLAAAGKLSLNDTVRKHLPDYPSPVADKITVQQLVDHKSGLGDFFGPEYLAAPPSSIRKLSDYLPLFVDKPLEFEPGTEQRYSNAGFIVLGLIIERVTGQSYYDYVREHIFKPAGMKDTDSFAIDAKVPNRATPVTKRGSTQLPGRGSSAGGGYSTAEDLLRFSQALRADKLVSKTWTDWIFRGNEQRFIDTHPRLALALRFPAPLLARDLHQSHLFLTAQHGSRSIGQLEHRVAIAILLQQAVADQLVDPVSQFRLPVGRKKTVCAEPVVSQ